MMPTEAFTKLGMDDIIELDYTNQEMRREMIEAMKFWVREADIDGFRCDLASWVEVDFWEQARPETEKIKPLFLLVNTMNWKIRNMERHLMPATHGNGCTLRKTFIKQSATFESYRSVKAIFSYSIFQYAGLVYV